VLCRIKKICTTKYIKNMSLYSGFYGIQAITYYMAIGSGANVSQMSPITRSQVILTVLLAAVFIKERERLPIKIFSAMLVMVGALLIK
jgi:uncharacterized membrane protein